MNTFGTYFRMTSFGESHGVAMGVVVDGCPSGIPFSSDLLTESLNRRKPGRFPWQSSRTEPDKPHLLSGVFDNKTLGTPIAIMVYNQDAKPEDYQAIKKKPRVGHADDVWKQKFQHVDHRGGGRASGRETVSRVMGGAIARMFLNHACPSFQILSYTTQVGHYVLEPSDFSLEKLWSHSKQIESYPCYFPHSAKAEQVKQLLISAKEQGGKLRRGCHHSYQRVTGGIRDACFS